MIRSRVIKFNTYHESCCVQCYFSIVLFDLLSDFNNLPQYLHLPYLEHELTIREIIW